MWPLCGRTGWDCLIVPSMVQHNHCSLLFLSVSRQSQRSSVQSIQTISHHDFYYAIRNINTATTTSDQISHSVCLSNKKEDRGHPYAPLSDYPHYDELKAMNVVIIRRQESYESLTRYRTA